MSFLSTPSGWRATHKAYKDLQDWVFLSTPSGWRATSPCDVPLSAVCISIHALRVEGDGGCAHGRICERDFYPRPPGGGRRRSSRICSKTGMRFLSTPSGWRATTRVDARWSIARISIHALRVEGDPRVRLSLRQLLTFLSTPSGWRATTHTVSFASTSSDFYPRPPGGGRPFTPEMLTFKLDFYPRPPGGGRHESRRKLQCCS